QIPDESVTALLDDGVDEIALALEVAVEGVVGESRGGHDVGDARGFAPGEQFASAPDQRVDVAARSLLSGRQASLHGLVGAWRPTARVGSRRVSSSRPDRIRVWTWRLAASRRGVWLRFTAAEARGDRVDPAEFSVVTRSF